MRLRKAKRIDKGCFACINAVRGSVKMAKLVYDETGRLLFTKEMRKENYTILIPMMARIHFEIMKNVYAIEHLKKTSSILYNRCSNLSRYFYISVQKK